MKNKNSNKKQNHKPLYLPSECGAIFRQINFSAKEVATADEIVRQICNGKKIHDSVKTLVMAITYWSAKAITAEFEAERRSMELMRIADAFETIRRFSKGDDVSL